MHIHGKFHVLLTNHSRSSDILQKLDSKQFYSVVLPTITETPIEQSKSNEEITAKRCSDSWHLASLLDIHRFDTLMKEGVRSSAGLKLMLMIDGELGSQIKNLFLLGCHLILSQGIGFEETLLSFKCFHILFEKYFTISNISVENSLRSLCCAKCLDWINLRNYQQCTSSIVNTDFRAER